MKKPTFQTMLTIALLVSAVNLVASGVAYRESCIAAIQCGKYPRGDREWDEKNREWLDSDSDEPYPDDLRDVDGKGYEDSRDAGSHPEDAR